jgi:dTDP-4-amino-4,6-dideoxygalactose transaminase
MSAPTTAAGVPFVDLGAAHAELAPRILDDIADLIQSGAFTNGPAVQSFEHEWAAFCGTAAAVGVGSGLAGLRLALQAARIGPGDEVIAPAHTFVATVEAITQAGADPVLVDVTEDDGTMDVAAAAASVTARTRALLPVHLYGHMADMRSILHIGARAGAAVFEDACQAHGAARDGLAAGAAGLAGAFSFYPAKNLGAFGDAGAVVTDDPGVAQRIRVLRQHGETSKYHHAVEGDTARLDTIQAMVLRRKLPLLAGWNRQRRAAAALYAEALAGVGDLELPRTAPGSTPVWHLYVVRTERRDALAAHLAARGVATGMHYPEPVHLTPAYRRLGHRPGAFPASERYAARCLSLPIYPGISEGQIGHVADAVEGFFRYGG